MNEDIRKLVTAASPGPWTSERGRDPDGVMRWKLKAADGRVILSTQHSPAYENALFLTRARFLVADLLADNERLREEILTLTHKEPEPHMPSHLDLEVIR